MKPRNLILILALFCSACEKQQTEQVSREELVAAFEQRDAAIEDIVKVIKELPDYKEAEKKLKESKEK